MLDSDILTSAQSRLHPVENSALSRDWCASVTLSAGGACDSAVIDSRYNSARQRVSFCRVDLRLDPLFSRKAAFLLDAMAAPASALRVTGLASTPRKWVSGGLWLVAYASESAPTLPGVHERAVARLLWCVSMSTGGSLRFSSHTQPLQSRAAARVSFTVEATMLATFRERAARDRAKRSRLSKNPVEIGITSTRREEATGGL